MQFRIEDGAIVSQDFHMFKWKDHGEVFLLESLINNDPRRARLIAYGYGEPGSGESYGNGCIYANYDDLILVDNMGDVIPEKPTANQIAWVFEQIIKNAEAGGNFRNLVYDLMGLSKEDYLLLYEAGGLNINQIMLDYYMNRQNEFDEQEMEAIRELLKKEHQE